MNASVDTLTDKIHSLSAEQIAQVEDFVEFVRVHGQHPKPTRAAAIMSAPAFEAVWDNPEDAAYDAI